MERRSAVRHAGLLLCMSMLLAPLPAPAAAPEQAPPADPAHAREPTHPGETTNPAEHVMVLIVGSASPVQHLNVIDVRKLFLGFTVISDGLQLRALDNRSDDGLRQAFLQNVIAMSELSYERRLLSITLQQGARRPEVFGATKDLLNAVAADPRAVSVAWAADVAKDHRIRVLRVLWRD